MQIKDVWGNVLKEINAADLQRAYLQRAYLQGADLQGSDLQPVRDDFWAVLSSAPHEVEGLRKAIVEGKIDGSTYTGECACLVGTIAKVCGKNHENLGLLIPNPARPIERFFMGIKKGDSPETNQFSKIALKWLDEWVKNMQVAFGVKK